MKIININNVSVKIDNNYILKNLNLDVDQGEFLILKGPSGCGKSTVLNVIAKLIKPTEGEVLFKGSIVKNLSKYYRNNLSYVFQNSLLDNDSTVIKNLKSVCNTDSLYFEEIVTKLKINNLFDQNIASLSGGEKQRVAIARSVLKDFDILLCDEPTGALDYDNALLVVEILKYLNDIGKTIIMVTHDQSLLKYATRVLDIKEISDK